MENSVQNTNRTINTTRTSQTRERQRFTLSSNYVPDAEDPDDTLEELLYKTWTIFGVSTFFNFHQDEVHLKQYSKRLREEVAITLAQEDVTYNAKVYVMDNVATRPSPMDPPPMKVEVYAKKYSNEETVEKCIYNGMFLSWGTAKKELTVPNCIRLPLLLCRGTKSGMNTVHNVLSLMFDCTVVALPVSEDDLIWLVPIVITPTNEEGHLKHTDKMCMEYKMTKPSDTDTITVHFQISDLIRMLTVIIKDQSDETNIEISFDLEHIEKCRQALYDQILQIAGLQMGLCMLCKIHFSAFTIMENKMKITNFTIMNRVLLYLNKKALDIFHTFNFEIFRNV
ncbi:centromere protein L [Colletes latitarsis]|uniref:centromere protein L n=1 Tax=Colletes latitarsis TaxID=2605962 RepID=UPI0040351167